MSNQDKENELLILWMQLNRAISAFARTNAIPISSIHPWECADAEVSRVWEEITHPDNLPILQDWLAAEEANEQASELTEQAIRICRERTGKRQ